ncbi:MAG: hypothetical protein JNL08_13250 [Planctomycetes bacterium]|nr:hypothetical protein [Planctomycetota bacterium]
MSSKHRRGLPKKRPDPKAQQDIAADLPELEPVDAADLPTLEPVADDLPVLEPLEAADDGPVRVDAKAVEANFHVTLTVTIAAMPKEQVADAVVAPLRRAAQAEGVRHKRVLVRFTGDAIVGSAAKTRVAELMRELKPLVAVVRRGYGDETVFEGALPTVDVNVRSEGDTVHVDVATGATEACDLTTALTKHLPRIAASRGKGYVFAFRGAAAGTDVHDQIAAVLHDAGAVRATVDGKLLFDRELTDRITVAPAGRDVVVGIDPAADDGTTLWALASVLPLHAGAIGGKSVTVRPARPLSAAVVAACVESCRHAGATRVVLAAADGDRIVWPPLLERTDGAAVTLRVDAGGRERAALLAAFRHEAAAHRGATDGRDVVVDWPAGTTVDGELETFCRDELGALLRPKTLACTVAGAQREPMLPDPASLTTSGDQLTLRLDTEAGKPVELQRAVDRRLASLRDRFRGASVRVQVAGAAPVSRTLLKALYDGIAAAGARRLEVDDHGTVDVLLPPFLNVTKVGDEIRIEAAADARGADQVTRALQRELAADAIPAGATVVVQPSPAAEAIVATAIARGAGKVVLGGPAPVVVHPPLFGKPEKTGLSRRLPVTPGGDAAMVERQVERELPTVLASLGGMMTATIHVDWPGAEATSPAVVRLVQGLVGKKAAKVLLDAGGKPVQLHPPLPGAAPIAPVVVPPPAPAPVAAPVAPSPAAPVAPSAPAASVPAADDLPTLEPEVPEPSAPAGPLVTLLGQKDTATPPLRLVGVEVGTDAAHLQRVEAELQALRPRLEGTAVLLVLRRAGADVPVRREDELVAALRRHCAGVAAATLVFRGPDAAGRPFFQVTHSAVAGLAAGAAIADPRPR